MASYYYSTIVELTPPPAPITASVVARVTALVAVASGTNPKINFASARCTFGIVSCGDSRVASLTTTTINLGSTPVAEAAIVITDARIQASTIIDAFVIVDSTGDNTQADHQHAASSWQITCLAAAGSFTLDIQCLIDLCWGTFNIRYVYV